MTGRFIYTAARGDRVRTTRDHSWHERALLLSRLPISWNNAVIQARSMRDSMLLPSACNLALIEKGRDR
jgi:hypothetical protein